MYNGQEMLNAFKEIRNVRYFVYAVKENENCAEVFIALKEKTNKHFLWDKYYDAGCRTIRLDSHGRGNDSVVSALARLLALATDKDCKYGIVGTPDMLLLAKAMCSNAGCAVQAHSIGRTNMLVHNEGQETEFDFIKKKRRMEQSPPDDEDESPEVHAEFQAFIDAVWPALESVCLHDEQLLQEDLRWVEEQKTTSVTAQPSRNGFVYAAWNSCFPELVKVGATKRDTPFARLKELSGSNVPHPFELVACLPSKDPFALEKSIHAHFKDVRIRKGARYCEFFRLTRETVSEYFSSLHLESCT